MKSIIANIICLVTITSILCSCDDIEKKVKQSPKIEETIKTIAAVDSLTKYYNSAILIYQKKADEAKIRANEADKKYREVKAKYNERANLASDTWLAGSFARMYDSLEAAKTGEDPYSAMQNQMNRFHNEYEDEMNEMSTNQDKVASCETKLSSISRISTYADLQNLSSTLNSEDDANITNIYKELPQLEIKKVSVLDKNDGKYNLTIISNYDNISLVYDKSTDTVLKIMK